MFYALCTIQNHWYSMYSWLTKVKKKKAFLSLNLSRVSLFCLYVTHSKALRISYGQSSFKNDTK